MKELKMPLVTSKFTKVLVEEEIRFNAPHKFTVVDASNPDKVLADIHFQEDGCKDCGVNGIANEDLINMVICRLEHFQKSDYRCRENSLAITKLEEALLWLRKRTMDREQRDVEGTSEL